jgi:hypothetical protein
MTTTLPYNVSDNTLTFFARSRPYEVQRGHKHFDHIKGILTSWRDEPRADTDVDSLIALADPKEEIMRAAGGKLEFRGSEIFYGTTALHNLWVDKILAFRDAGMPYDPIFAALQDLQLNPTPAARERLPIFVERSKLGFLPDGRIAAFKGVRDNYNDVHSNTVNYAVGKTVAIPRAACNADPNQTCVAGLHVGAIDYIQQMGYGWGSDRRMLLCAFWPRHAVAVPTDYRGGKMRVEQLEVLDEVSREYVDELLNNGQLIVRGYQPSSSPAASESAPFVSASTAERSEPAFKAKVGDWIEVEDDSDLSDGFYLVHDEPGATYRVEVKTFGSNTEMVDNDAVISILAKPPAFFLAKVGDWVETSSDSTPRQVTKVTEGELGPEDSRLTLTQDQYGDTSVENGEIESILAEPPAIGLRVRDNDKVRIEGHSFLRDGVYDVYDIDTYRDGGDDEQRVEISTGDGDTFYIKNRVIKAIVREEEEAAAAPAAAASPSTALVVTGAPADTSPLWEQVLVGDLIRIEDDGEVADGEYLVQETDEALTQGPQRVGIRVDDDRDGSYGSWIYNESVKAIVEREGKPFGKPATPATDEPVWKQAQEGDTVRIEGSSWMPDDVYTVDKVIVRTDSDEYSFRVQNGLWVEKKAVKAIVTRDGKPFGAPATDILPPYKQAEVGDTVTVKGSSDTLDGEYVVSAINDGSTYRVSVDNTKRYSWGFKWVIANDAIVGVRKKSEAPAITDQRPAFERAKVGDTVKLRGVYGRPAGEYVVDQVDQSNGMGRRLRVNNPGAMWVDNHLVEAITKAA